MSPANPSLTQRPRSARLIRFGLVGMVGLFTLVAIFYTVENWRGKQAWEQCKRELESKGQKLDWDAYVPAPVPDNQNIFKAPKMEDWFVGRGATELSRRLDPSTLLKSGTLSQFAREQNPVVELTVIPPGARIDPADADLVVRFDQDNGSLAQFLKGVAEQNTNGLFSRSLKSPQNLTFFAGPTNSIKPFRVAVEASKVLTLPEMIAFCPASPSEPTATRWQVEAVSANSFRARLSLPAAYSAADYLAWSDQFEPEFSAIREALKRPYARMDGDYQQPLTIPVPNFVTVRNVAQTLASRAQCHLLLGKPEAALRDLTLVHDLTRLLESQPTGKPMTLVAAMINVAVRGLYVNTVSEGFQLNAWREPQLIALQEQLKTVNLPAPVREAFQTEPVAMGRTLEITSAADMRKIFFADKKHWWEKVVDPLYLAFAVGPRGWRYQNIATIARLQQSTLEGIDLEHNLIRPGKTVELMHRIEEVCRHPSPYTFVAAMAVPNYSRATMTLAHNQTMANEALIACALERYRFAHNDYPETLDSLAPQYLEKVPLDLISGQPLIYRRVNNSRFTLYSIGWNEIDNHGTPSPEVKNLSAKYEEGDWVWGVR